MKQRRQFRPAVGDGLETRVVQSSIFDSIAHFYTNEFQTLTGTKPKAPPPPLLYIHEPDGSFKHVSAAAAKALERHDTLYVHQVNGLYRPFIPKSASKH